ncbi:hypothetical protein ABK040_002915 [Willaertia magna]
MINDSNSPNNNKSKLALDLSKIRPSNSNVSPIRLIKTARERRHGIRLTPTTSSMFRLEGFEDEEDDSSDDIMSTSTSNSEFDQLEDILTFQLPMSPKYKTNAFSTSQAEIQTNKRRKKRTTMINPNLCLKFSLDNFKGLIKSNSEPKNLENCGIAEEDKDESIIQAQLHVLKRIKKSEQNYAWIPITHTNDVVLYRREEETNGKSMEEVVNQKISFETTVSVDFYFEKVIPLLFALINTKTNQVLGTYEGTLAEICGSSGLMVRKKLTKQRKHFCDIVIQAIPPSAEKKKSKRFSKRFEDEIIVDLDSTFVEEEYEEDDIMSVNNNTPPTSNTSRRRKKKSGEEETFLDFEISFKLERKYKDCFMVVSQQFYSDSDLEGTFIPLYTSETNAKLTRYPSFGSFSIKPTMGFKRINFRFELFYWESVQKQQFEDSTTSSKFSGDLIGGYHRHYLSDDINTPLSPDFRNDVNSSIGHYKTLIGTTELSYSELMNSPPPNNNNSVSGTHNSNGSANSDSELLGPCSTIANLALSGAIPINSEPIRRNSTDISSNISIRIPRTPKKRYSKLHGRSISENENNLINSPNTQQSSNNNEPLIVPIIVDKKVHTMKEETLHPLGVNPEDSDNLAVVHRRRKVLSVISVQSGNIVFKNVKERKTQMREQTESDVTYSFLDYMKAGLRFKMYFALDFTKDNCEPRNESNLHRAPRGQKSIYEQSMEAIGKRIAQYESNLTSFHLVGFGNDRKKPVFNLYECDDEELSASSSSFRDLCEDKTQNYIYSVLYPRYNPPLKLHQLSPIYRQYVSQIQTFKLSMQDCVKTSHYAFTETNVHQGTAFLQNVNKYFVPNFDTYQQRKEVVERTISPPEFVHLTYGIDKPVHNKHVTYTSPRYANSCSGIFVSLDEESEGPHPRFKQHLHSHSSNQQQQKTPVFKMNTKYAPNDFYPVISDVIDLSCNLKNEESITETLINLHREKQRLKNGEKSNLFLTNNSIIYNILVIMVPNDFIHVEETIYKYVEASHKAALSIIVIGVGSGSSFKTHRSINLNTKVVSNVGSNSSDRKSLQFRVMSKIPTTSDLQYRGLRAARDCVTFVRLNDYETVSEAAEAALRNIPSQVCRYMKMKGKGILSNEFF